MRRATSLRSLARRKDKDLTMATQPPKPDRIEPNAPPERPVREPDPVPDCPPETEPVPPDIDEPDISPDEFPSPE